MDAEQKTENVFVYGTLKRGHVNHTAISALGLKNVRGAHLQGFLLFEVRLKRLYPYPALRPGLGKILGEICQLENQNGLSQLDHLELVGHEYLRIRWWAHRGHIRQQVWVYVYMRQAMARRKPRKIHGTKWPENRNG